MSALTVVVTVLTALLFLAAAVLKFRRDPHAMRTRDRLGIPPGRYTLIGVCEVAGAAGAVAGLAVLPVGVVALAGLTLVALAACAAQLRLRNPPGEAAPAVLALILAPTALALQLATG